MIFWTEASRDVGTGHFMECLALAEHAEAMGEPVSFAINQYSPMVDALSDRHIPYDFINTTESVEVAKLCDVDAAEFIIVNHRKVRCDVLEVLKSEGRKLIVIDQLGGIGVVCDMLINSSIVSEWINYVYHYEVKAKCFGPKFAIMRPAFKHFHDKQKEIRRDKKRILVSMGGVDRTGATLNILDALAGLKGDAKVEFILGSGYAHSEEFLDKVNKVTGSDISYSYAVTDFAERLYESDLLISSGGNTLYEAACVGTPALVLWEDSHEAELGEAFSARGSARIIGNGVNTHSHVICDAIDSLLADHDGIEGMSGRGKDLVDGRGVERILSRIHDVL